MPESMRPKRGLELVHEIALSWLGEHMGRDFDCYMVRTIPELADPKRPGPPKLVITLYDTGRARQCFAEFSLPWAMRIGYEGGEAANGLVRERLDAALLSMPPRKAGPAPLPD